MRAPRLSRWIGLSWSLRRLLKTLDQLAVALAAQNQLLTRLADHLAPLPATTPQAEVRVESGVSHVNEAEIALVEQFVARVEHDTGHTPDEDEILTYLADEKTIDWQARLVARDRDRDDRPRRREAP